MFHLQRWLPPERVNGKKNNEEQHASKQINKKEEKNKALPIFQEMHSFRNFHGSFILKAQQSKSFT